MVPRATRSKATKAERATPPTPSKIVSKKLLKTENEQHKLFILPQPLSSKARIVSLPNPVSGTPSRYLFCPDQGLFEFTRTSARKSAPSSWLLAQDNQDLASAEDTERRETPLQSGYVLEDADLFLATPMDPLFLLMPLFMSQIGGGNAMFKMEDDYMQTLSAQCKSMERMLRNLQFRNLVLRRLESVSQVQDLGYDKVYKPDIGILVGTLLGRVQCMIEPGCWSMSMEDAHVRKPLEIQVVSRAQANVQLPTPEDTQNTLTTADEKGTVMEESLIDVSAVSTEVTILMRTRVAFNFIMSSYIPAKLRTKLVETLASSKLVDFQPLDEHLEKVQKAKLENQALRSLSDNISRKRGLMDDDEAAEVRAEKKRRKDEEELKKKNESRGIKQLKKVNVSGMQKMSSFFTAVPKAIAKKK